MYSLVTGQAQKHARLHDMFMCHINCLTQEQNLCRSSGQHKTSPVLQPNKQLHKRISIHLFCMYFTQKYLKCVVTRICSLQTFQPCVILVCNLQFSCHSDKCDLWVGVKWFYVYLNLYSVSILLKSIWNVLSHKHVVLRLQWWLILEHNLQYSCHSGKRDLGVGVKLFYVYWFMGHTQ